MKEKQMKQMKFEVGSFYKANFSPYWNANEKYPVLVKCVKIGKKSVKFEYFSKCLDGRHYKFIKSNRYRLNEITYCDKSLNEMITKQFANTIEDWSRCVCKAESKVNSEIAITMWNNMLTKC